MDMYHIVLICHRKENQYYMIKIHRKEDCCGCGACSNVCKKKAIRMLPDDEGFSYPTVDNALCNNCKQCETVCPFGHPNKPLLELSQVYTAKNKNDFLRRNSSSGGIFPLIASWALDNRYSVIGVGFDKNWHAEHQLISDQSHLPRLCRSKYTQSNTREIYVQVQAMLQKGEKVLFSGTPCQCSALRLFLKKNYDGLICVDIICHGVPSPKVWDKYLDEKCEEFDEQRKDIIDVQFKIKDSSKGYVWRRPGFSIKWEDGTEFSSFGNKTSYENGYLCNLFVRPSCHNCRVKNISSGSDITIGDYWGCNDIMPEFDDINGVSLVFLNTDKGKLLYTQVSDEVDSIRLTTQEAVYHNDRIVCSTKPHPNRKRFFLRLDERMDNVIPVLLHLTWSQKIIKKFKCIINKYFSIK